MRVRLDIYDDVLQAVKELAQREGTATGRVLSRLARAELASPTLEPKGAPAFRGGVPLPRSRGEIITSEKVKRLMDQEGI